MTPHLRDHVRAYIDRSLPEVLLRIYDQHLVACECCRAAAEQERRIVATLRSGTPVPDALRASLIGLGRTTAGLGRTDTAPGRTDTAPAVGRAAGSSVVPVPQPPSPRAVPPAWLHSVPTVSPNAPALHRSPVRAAVFASVAAGASVVAALGITASAPVSSPAPGPPAARIGVATGTTTTPAQVRRPAPQTPQVLLVRLPSAQSGP